MAETELILAVETSSRIGSVALARGAELLAETRFSAPLKHSAEIFPAISDLLGRFELQPGRIDQVFISGGPGSFTGLRIATTFAKTMHLAVGAKVVSVDTLDAVAANVIDLTQEGPSSDAPSGMNHQRVATIVDAKRGQFFVAVYDRSSTETNRAGSPDEWAKVLPDCLMRPNQFVEEFGRQDRDMWLLGDGLLYHKDKFRSDGIRFFDDRYWSPRAAKIHLLGHQMAASGQFSEPLTLTPNYLRGPDVKLKTR